MIYHSTQIEEVLSNFEVDALKGLPTGVVDQRYDEHNENILKKSQKTPLSKIISEQIKNPVNILLAVSAFIAFIINLVYKEGAWFAPLLIILMLAINIAATVFFSKESEKTADKLTSINIPRVKVLRDGIIKTIDSRFVVCGDILILETGDYISADARLIETVDFRCDESFVTGEEITAQKDAEAIFEDITPINQRSNMVFSGSNVITGHAKAVVTEIGMNTETGKAVTLLESYNSINTKLKDKLNSIGKVSSVILIILCIIAFFTNVIINFRSQQEFAVTLANSLINSVVLLVSVLPEGLPLIAASALGISVNVLYKSGMITKNYSVFDALPDVSVICSDKTGTLTKDTMKAEQIFNGQEIIDVNDAFKDSNCVSILRLASLCTSQSKEDVDSVMYNDATELAIIDAYKQSVVAEERDIHNNYPLLCKLPFDSERKITVTVNMINGTPIAIVKGAPDYLLSVCGVSENKAILSAVEDFALDGMRVIAVAYKPLSEIPSNPEISELEEGMTFAGLVALSDPPQDESIALVKDCKKGGIKTVMITGDHIATARAVAKKMRILNDDSEAISGEEIAEMTDEELAESINKYTVFARLLPDQKYRLVAAYKANGLTVAITGDSVNDAQALSIADVGIAMGNRGTDVARGAADIIMNENRFSAITTAISISRSLISTIRKALVYLISSNIGELLSVLICLFAFKAFPLTASAFLLLNLITDVFPALSILSDGIHDRKPFGKLKESDKHLFKGEAVITLAVQGLMVAFTAVLTYGLFLKYGEQTASTMMFTVLVSSQYLNMVTSKFEALFFKNRHFVNIPLSIVLFALALITFLVITTPLGTAFGMTVLTFVQIIKAILISSIVFASGELIKLGFILYKKLK